MLYALPLAHGWSYREVLPGLGFVPQLDFADGAALLVVYTGISPLRPGPPGGPGPIGPHTVHSPTPSPVPTLAPGSRDVCIAAGDPRPTIYEDVPFGAFHPERASLTARSVPAAGQAHVVARLKASTSSLAWDAVRHVLWFTVQRRDTDTALYRLDPVTREMSRWPLPPTEGNGFTDQVAVDATGAVWFDQYGYTLYRFDAQTQRLASLAFSHTGMWISGMATDGGDVFLAREDTPSVTRVDAGMHVADSIAISREYAGASQIALLGDRLLLGGNTTYGLFTLSGQLVRTLAITRVSGVIGGPDRLLTDPRGRATVWQGPFAALIDASGARVAEVSFAFDLPLGPFADTYEYASSPRPESLATAWDGRVWYTLGTYLIEVAAAEH